MNEPEYRAGYDVTHVAADVASLPDDAPVRVAGRVVGWRQFGKLTSGTTPDRSGKAQVGLRRDDLPEDRYVEWAKGVSLGDFIGVSGRRWTTNKGEPTVRVEDLEVLSPTHRSMPDKWLGISDAETLQRKRYLDLLTNDSTRD